MIKKIIIILIFLSQIYVLGQDTIKVFFAGDTYFGWGAEYMYENRSKKLKIDIYNIAWKNIKDYINADIRVVNFEGAIIGKGEPLDKQFNLKMKPQYTEILKRGKIDIVSLANNHVMDFKEQGLDSTLFYLNKYNIKYFGAGENIEKALKPVIVNKGDTKICFIGFSIIGPEQIFAQKNKYGIAGSYDLNQIIKYAKQIYEDYKDSCDIMIAYMHWGKEKKNSLSYAQKYLSKKLIDLGYDAIIGSHPHVVQGIDTYRGKYIFYSLGNFIFGGNDFEPQWTISVNLLIKDKTIIDYEVIPFYTYPQKTGHSPFPANDSLTLEINNYLNEFNTN